MIDLKRIFCNCGHQLKDHHLTEDADETYPWSICNGIGKQSHKNDCLCTVFTDTKYNLSLTNVFNLARENGPLPEEKIDISETVCVSCSHTRKFHFPITLDGQEECYGAGNYCLGMGIINAICKCSRFWDGEKKTKISLWEKIKELF